MIRPVCIGLLLCACSNFAQAESLAASGYLAPAQVLQCLRDREEVERLNTELSAEKSVFDRTAANLQQQQFQLEQRGQELAALIQQQNQLANQTPPPVLSSPGDPQLDRYLRQHSGTMAVRRKHNKAVAGHKQQLDLHNAQVDLYNLRLAGLRQRAQIVDRYCAGAKVRPQDLAAAKAILTKQPSMGTAAADIKPR